MSIKNLSYDVLYFILEILYILKLYDIIEICLMNLVNA